MKHIDPLSYADAGAGAIPFAHEDRTIILVTTPRHADADAIARIRVALPGSEVVNLSHRDIAAPAATLTERQREILGHLLGGLSNKEIGRKLGLSHFTVRNHVSNILRILGYPCRRTMRRSLTPGRATPIYPVTLAA